MPGERDVIIPNDPIERALATLPMLPFATQAGMAPPSSGPRPSIMEMVAQLSSALSLALPGRGGIGAPWRPSPAQANSVWSAYRLRQPGQEMADVRFQPGFKTAVSGGSEIHQSGGGVFKDTVGAMPPEAERAALFNMLFRALSLSSRQ